MVGSISLSLLDETSPLFSNPTRTIKTLTLLSTISGSKFTFKIGRRTHNIKPEPLGKYHVLGSVFSTNTAYYKQALDAYKRILWYSSAISSGYEHIRSSVASHPLCLMICAEPGSGKSFFVKQLRESLYLHNHQFPSQLSLINMSEHDSWFEACSQMEEKKVIWERHDPLKLPFVFFDEVDSNSWYRHLLAPMNDGYVLFKDRRWLCAPSVWCFAASTAKSWDAFLRLGMSAPATEKQVDFASRIEAHIDIASISGKSWENAAGRLLISASIFSARNISRIPLEVLLYYGTSKGVRPLTARSIEAEIRLYGPEQVAEGLRFIKTQPGLKKGSWINQLEKHSDR